MRARRRAAAPGAGPSSETLAVRAQGRWELHDPPSERARDAAGAQKARVHRVAHRFWPEPQRPPVAFAGLLETVAENGLQQAVAAHRVAAHPAWRQVALTTLPWRPRHGTSIRSNSGRVVIAPATSDGDAPAAPLDEILDGVQGVGLIKVDANGLSAEILGSGRRTLSRDRPLVAAQAASTPERHALRALLSRLRYREVKCFCWTATWLWEPIPVDSLPNAAAAGRHAWVRGRPWQNDPFAPAPTEQVLER